MINKKSILLSVLSGMVLAGFFSFGIYVFATPPDSKYSPGETLDPSCVVGSTNCTVTAPVPYTGATDNVDLGSKNLTTTGTASVATGTISGTLKILESTGSTYYTIFQGGDQSADVTYTLPTALPASNKVLQSTSTGTLSWETAGAGDVVGPSSSTDNAIVRFDSTTGKLIQNSGVTIDDSNNLMVPGTIIVGNTSGAMLSATNGIFTLTGQKSSGNNENLLFDFETTANVVSVGSSTGVTKLNFNALGVNVSGNVGVGTTSPGTKLEVVGDITSKGTSWTARTEAEANAWWAVAYGNGLFVAVAADGTNRVQTSPDGINWTSRSASEANTWLSIAYGNGLFVAVSNDGTNRVMTSPDGITWTARSASEASTWRSITYGNGLFAAIAGTGTNRVMTSPDGITWTSRSAAEANAWRAITYGNGLFVAVSTDGTNQVMTSPDGITWTARAEAEANAWLALTYGNGLFVAVSSTGTNRVQTSPDGITWTARSASAANTWTAVTYGNGLFVAVNDDGTNRVQTSPDGITWTARSASAANRWNSITYGNGVFVAIAQTTGTNLVMTSGTIDYIPFSANNIQQGYAAIHGSLKILESGTTPTYYTIFAGGDQSADLTYTLPTAYPASNKVLQSTSTGTLSWESFGAGDVVGPSSSTDNAIVRFDSTTGKLIQNSGVTIDDSNNLTVPGTVIVGNTSGAMLSASNGVLTLTGQKASGNNENLTFDFETTANVAAIGTSTGVTTLDFNALSIITTGTATAGNAAVNGSFRIREGGSTPTLYTTFVGGDQSADLTYTLPTAYPASNKILQSTSAGVLSWETAGAGDVVGPGSSTDNAVVRFDSTTGKLIQDSGVLIDDSNNVTVPGTLKVGDTTGTQLSATSGVFTLAGLKSSGNNENLIFDFETTSNVVSVGSSTGVTNLDFTGLDLSTTAHITAGTARVTTSFGVKEGGSSPQYYTTFVGGDQSAGLTYTLPTAYPASSKALQSTSTGTLSWESFGTGDVVGPASSTDNAAVRFDGTTGKLVQNSGVTIDDSDNILLPGKLTVGNATGVVVSGANGKLMLGGLESGGDNENLRFDFDFSADAVWVDSPSGVTDINFTTNLGATEACCDIDFRTLIAETSVKIREGGASPTYYTIFQGGDQSADVTYTLPTALPASNKVLQSTSTGTLSWETAGAGDVVGPASSTDNAIVRFDSTTGKLIQNSGVTIDDSNNLMVPGTIIVGNTSGAMLSASNGVLTLTGQKASGNNENLTFDFEATANEAAIGTGTGVTNLNFNALNLSTTGGISAGTARVTTSFGIKEGGASPQYYTTFVGGDQAASFTYTLPTALPASDKVLQSDSLGILSWVSGGEGDVVGPDSSTDNAVVRFDSTTGKLVQNSGVLIDDSDNITIPGNMKLGAGTLTIGSTGLIAAAPSGKSATVSGSGAVAFTGGVAYADDTFAFGSGTGSGNTYYSTASAAQSIAFSGGIASGAMSFAVGATKGAANLASGTNSFAIGANVSAGGAAAAAFGTNNGATADQSSVFGLGNTADTVAETVVGKYGIDSNDYLFIVGNGTNESTRDNAFGVSADGGVYIPDVTTCTEIETDSNGKIICRVSSERYKEKIDDLSFDKEKFLSLRPVSFEYRQDLSFNIPGGQMGFIAEEVEKIFPELVKYKGDQVESVKYDRLPIYLYEVIQEQQKDIELLKTLNGLNINSDGSAGEGGLTFNGYHSLLDSVHQLIALSGIVIENGITTIQGLVTDKATIKTARIERLEMVDSKTGDIYCTWLADGDWQKAKGECTLISGMPPEFPETFPSSPAEAIDQIEEIQKSTERLEDIADQATQVVNDAQSTVEEAKEIVEESQETIEKTAKKAAQEAAQETTAEIQEEVEEKIEKEVKEQLKEEKVQQSLEEVVVQEPVVEEVAEEAAPVLEVAPEEVIEEGVPVLEVAPEEETEAQEGETESTEPSAGDLILDSTSALMDKMTQFIVWMVKEITPVSVKQSVSTLAGMIKNPGPMIVKLPQRTSAVLQSSTAGLMGPFKDIGQFIIESIFH